MFVSDLPSKAKHGALPAASPPPPRPRFVCGAVSDRYPDIEPVQFSITVKAPASLKVPREAGGAREEGSSTLKQRGDFHPESSDRLDEMIISVVSEPFSGPASVVLILFTDT